LSLTMADLRGRNEELDAFAHTVAHDLKNPVALIVGHAELLVHNDVTQSDDERQQSLQTIEKTGYRISTIINELLLLARLRQSEVETAPLDMVRIVADSLGRLADNIKAARAEIVWPDAPTWLAALGYSPWLEEVWANYLSNALKYGGTPLTTPCIELGATLQPAGMVRFWVRDHGPGLSREAQSRLFTPFTRLDQVHLKGHGLGLSIVRRIVEKLGGQVGLISQVGDGSTFYFDLPTTGRSIPCAVTGTPD
jgi:two-component system sensor histidine kinase/response regulator